jgi:hypothetical protein
MIHLTSEVLNYKENNSVSTVCRSGFTTLPPVLVQEQPAVVLLLESALVSWPLAIDERSGHEDLRGLGRRSVISYVHGRTWLYCSSRSCLCEPEPSFSQPTCCLCEPFIAQGRAVTL